jgi:hypothetical protein
MCSEGNAEFKWQHRLNTEDVGTVAMCGHWMVTLARNAIYSPGLLFVEPIEEKKGEWPLCLGDLRAGEIRSVPEPDELFRLVDELSVRMREHMRCILHDQCRCRNVYLISLNENKGRYPLHFRLWPRYDHDQHMMDMLGKTGEQTDGFALMAFWREQYLRRLQTNEWGHWPPDKDRNPDAWRQYAVHIKHMLVPDMKS